MKLADRLKTAGIVGLAGLVSFTGMGKKAEGGVMKISTNPSASVMAREQSYRMDVKADSTDVSDKKIRSAEWDVNVPSYLTITGADWPSYPNNPSTDTRDFFYNFLMKSTYNRVDSTVSEGELSDNCRLTNNVFDGPQNSNGVIGGYCFTVNPDAPLGETSFGLNSIYFYDTTGGSYISVLGNSTLKISVVNNPFTIARAGDANLDGMVNVGDLGILGSHYGENPATWLEGDFNNDGAVNVGDLGILGDNYGAGAGGAGVVPEPASGLALIVLGGIGLMAEKRKRDSEDRKK